MRFVIILNKVLRMYVCMLMFCLQVQKSLENSDKSSPVMSSATATATSQQFDELLPDRQRNSRTYSTNTIHRQTNIF